MNIIEGPKLGISGKIEQWEVVNRDGSIARSCYIAKSNLITDSGLDLFCTTQTRNGGFSWNVWNYFAIGTSETCPNINNPVVSTLDEEYGTVRSTFTYSTWDTSSKSPVGGEDGHFYFNITRGVQLPAGTLNGSYTELGFSPTSAKNSPLFSKFRFVDEEGTPVSVPIQSDQILRLRYTITVEVTPITTYTGTTPISGPIIGGDYTYTAFWCQVFSFNVTTLNFTYATSTIYGCYCYLDTSDVILKPIDSTYYGEPAYYYTTVAPIVGADYISGSHYIYKDIVFPSSYGTWPAGIKSLRLFFVGGYYTPYIVWSVNFDTPIVKLNTHNLSFRMKFSWGRV